MMVVCLGIRKKLALNNAFDLVLAGEEGDNLFASSRPEINCLKGASCDLTAMQCLAIDSSHYSAVPTEFLF